MTLTIAPDPVRDASLMHTRSKGMFTPLNLHIFSNQKLDTINDAIVFCQTCRHGGHASHIMEWFFGEDGRDDESVGGRAHDVCAVADCDCHCANEL